jgi:ribonucleoside-diphosphate reductase alpha subunit
MVFIHFNSQAVSDNVDTETTPQSTSVVDQSSSIKEGLDTPLAVGHNTPLAVGHDTPLAVGLDTPQMERQNPIKKLNELDHTINDNINDSNNNMDGSKQSANDFEMTDDEMYVVKRDGQRVPIQFDKITRRINNLVRQLGYKHINCIKIAQEVIQNVYTGITTSEIDVISARIAANMATAHPEYNQLGGAILVSNHQKNNERSFSETMNMLYNFHDKVGKHSPQVSKEFNDFVQTHATELNAMVDYTRDFLFDFFGIQTLFRSYLKKLNEKIVERPQDLLMRVAVGVNLRHPELSEIKELYDAISQKLYTHATPTLFNAGTDKAQLSSCFLLNTDDSIEAIFKTFTDCGMISKWSGGIGVAISRIRSKGSLIRGTGGEGSGIVPMLKTYESIARYINQGGKRNGSIAVYLEPWHSDIERFLELTLPTGSETERARDLFTALWVNDIFMRRVKENGTWSLFDPSIVPRLTETYGEEFEKIYLEAEEKKMYVRQIPAQKLWDKILTSQFESGRPYMCYKDHANRKSNQSNIGTINSSNLCAEIMEHAEVDEYAVCNLASLNLTIFVKTDKDGHKYFDFAELVRISRLATRNLNRVIDVNYYPTVECMKSNFHHRPIGLGVQGLADVFCLMGYPFDSPDARRLNKQIFETIYYGALRESVHLAHEREEPLKQLAHAYAAGHVYYHETDVYNAHVSHDVDTETRHELHELIKRYRPVQKELDRKSHYGAYSSFIGSPFSQGKFQFDLWNATTDASLGHDWTGLREKMVKHGTRNSLLTAIMPTASTSQLLGNNECIEPFTQNIYVRQTLAGKFIVVNQHLVSDLIKHHLWNESMRIKIIEHDGSVQNIPEIPPAIKELYKTAWEIKQRPLLDMSIERGAFVDQSQSLNLWMPQPNSTKLTAAHFYGWQNGLKTGLYYLRTNPAKEATKFAIEVKHESKHVDTVAKDAGHDVTNETASTAAPVCDVCSA